MRPITDPMREALIMAIRVDVLTEARQLADDMSDSLGNLHRLDYLSALDHLIRNARQDAADVVLVRPDDEATVRRVGAAIFDEIKKYPKPTLPWDASIGWGATPLDVGRAALAALDARPGTADTAHTEVEA